MIRTPLVAGNWKMHGSRDSIAQLLASIVEQPLPAGVEMAVFPPSVYLQQVADTLENQALSFGAQNVSQYSQGAYTGEASAAMLKDFACKYTLVGHSERRTLFGETSQQVAEKAQAALNEGLIPVICLGETLEQRETEQTEAVIAEQLQTVIDQLGEQIEQTVIAYEPVWAIGTGLSATPEQAQQVHSFIRQQLGAVAEKVNILYGGSVKASNASELFAQADIDGALIGGASLDGKEFVAIANIAQQHING